MRGIGEQTRTLLNQAKSGSSGNGTPSLKINQPNNMQGAAAKKKINPKLGESADKASVRFMKSKGIPVKDGRTGKDV